MTRKFWLVLIALSGLYVSCVMAANQAGSSLDSVVAVVNDGVITQSELNKAMKDLTDSLAAAGQPSPSAADLRKQALDALITRELQMQVAKRAKVTVSDKEIDEAIARVAANNKLTVAQLKEAVSKQGMSQDQFRKRIHNELLLVQIQRKALAGNLNVTDQEVKAFLNSPQSKLTKSAEYNVQDILLPVGVDATSEQKQRVRQKADTLSRDLQKGGNFEQLISDNYAKVINFGWRKVNEMPDMFVKQISLMQPKSFSLPIEAPNGYHILHLVDAKVETQKLTEAQAKDVVFQRKYQEQLQNWLQQLRAQSYIKIVNG